MESATRLRILRKHTVWFIDQDPTVITLKPRSAPVKGPGGGLKYSRASSRPPQRAKLIHQGGRGISTGDGGQDFKYEYVIVLPHDGGVAVGDEFVVDGRKFVVDSLDPDNGYERKAYARQHSSVPTDG